MCCNLKRRSWNFHLRTIPQKLAVFFVQLWATLGNDKKIQSYNFSHVGSWCNNSRWSIDNDPRTHLSLVAQRERRIAYEARCVPQSEGKSDVAVTRPTSRIIIPNGAQFARQFQPFIPSASESQVRVTKLADASCLTNLVSLPDRRELSVSIRLK